MKRLHVSFLLLFSLTLSLALFSLSCAKSDPTATNVAASRPTQPPAIKDGNYPGRGIVTKIDFNVGSVGLDHENIEGLMPAMQMEFYVTDKALLKGLTVGEKVDFVIEYNGGRETINSIKKAP